MSRLTALAATAALLVVAACGGSSDAGSSDAAWTFTDDLGTDLSLDAAPERIIAHKDVAAALGDMGLGDLVVGVFGAPDNPVPELGLQSSELDLSTVEDVTGGGEYGDIDLEKVAELQPDLVITSTFGDGALWYINDEVKERLSGSYDIAVLNYEGESVDSVLESSERLATALGAEEADFEAGREALAAAEARVADVAADAGDPSIVVVAPGPDLLYVANAPAYIDLSYLRDDIGLDLVTPAEDDLDDGDYWHSLSWENADFYADADVAMWDTRGGTTNLDRLGDQPIWQRVAAAEDDAYIPWRNETAPSAQGYATMLDLFADELREVTS